MKKELSGEQINDLRATLKAHTDSHILLTTVDLDDGTTGVLNIGAGTMIDQLMLVSDYLNTIAENMGTPVQEVMIMLAAISEA